MSYSEWTYSPAFLSAFPFAVRTGLLHTFVSCRETQVGSEGTVYEFMGLAVRRHDLVKL